MSVEPEEATVLRGLWALALGALLGSGLIIFVVVVLAAVGILVRFMTEGGMSD